MKRAQPSAADDTVARARALLDATSPAAGDIETAIVDVERQSAEAEATVAQLAADRPAILAAGTRADVAEHDERTADAGFARDQAHELATRLKVALVPAQEADRRDRAAAGRAKVEAKVAKAREALARYPAVAAEILLILGEVAHADAAAADFARTYPEEAAIVGAEPVTRYAPADRKIISSKRGWAWQADDGTFRAPDMPTRIIPDERVLANRPLLVHGTPRAGGFMGSLVTVEWWQRDFLAEIEVGLELKGGYVFRIGGTGRQFWPVEVTRHDVEIKAPWRPAPLALSVRLPALRLGDPSWYGSREGQDPSPAEVLTRLAAEPVDPRRPERKIEIEQVVHDGGLRKLPGQAPPAEEAAPLAPVPQLTQHQEYALDPSRMAGDSFVVDRLQRRFSS